MPRLNAQSLFKDNIKNFFFSLIKKDKEDISEEINWYNEWFRSREFAAPITYMPVEIRYGLGFHGKFSGSFSSPEVGDMDNWIWYDQDIAQLEQGPENTVGTSLDIDFGLDFSLGFGFDPPLGSACNFARNCANCSLILLIFFSFLVSTFLSPIKNHH